MFSNALSNGVKVAGASGNDVISAIGTIAPNIVDPVHGQAIGLR
jgi:hypothetical protein